jgi:hypothetical protein
MPARYRPVIITLYVIAFVAAIGSMLHRRGRIQTKRRTAQVQMFVEGDRRYHENQALLMAAHRGDMAMIRQYLPDVMPGTVENVVNTAGWEGRTEAVKYMFDQGYEPNGLGNGPNLLASAAAFGYDDLARLLLQRKVNLTAADLQEALTWSAARGHTEMVRLLLDHGADVNAVIGGRPVPEYAGLTPLMLAANFGHAEVVRLLLARHANVNLKSPFGKTALALAQVHSLTEALAPGETHTYKVTPQRAAAIKQRVDRAEDDAAVVALLRRAGATR